MSTHWFKLVTDGPVIATRNNTTVGAPTTLPYLPGSALLGVVAKHYAALLRIDEAATLSLFHRGAVQFGDGLPCSNEAEASVPLPLSTYRPKAHPEVDAWRNHLVESVPATEQPKQLRGGYYLVNRGEQLHTKMETSERTAIKDGSVRDGFLFSLQAIQMGQTFLSCVEIDDTVPTAIRDQVLKSLTGTLRIGRSRSAEFGRVMSTPLRIAPQTPALASKPTSNGEWAILLMSDCCLVHPNTGSPSFSLLPEMVGLAPDAFSLVAERSFTQTRTWSPYNAHRSRPSLERHVLTQGSVFSVTLGDGTSIETVRAAFKRGVGLHRSEGLGRCLVGPAFLHQGSPYQAPTNELSVRLNTTSLNSDPLFQWATARNDDHQLGDKALNLAKEWKKVLRDDFHDQRVSRSSWGLLRQYSHQYSDYSDFIDTFKSKFVEKNRGARSLSGWQNKNRSGQTTFAEQLLMLIQREKKNPVLTLKSIQLLTRLMVRDRQSTEAQS